jgi:guanylate kinase
VDVQTRLDDRLEPEDLVPERGRLIVLSGPSGVGKGTVLKGLLHGPRAVPRALRCTTATTRAPRPGEEDGVHYHFLSREQFEERIARGFFLEWARYNENLYGTPGDSVEADLARGCDTILEIEMQGALQVRENAPDAILIFLAPPSWEELERRLRGRATDDAASVERRLATARREMEAVEKYDYLIVNDDLSTAVDFLRAILLAERRRIVKRQASSVRTAR